MAQSECFALARSDLNAFLFSEVEVDTSGLPLSVVSLLARMGVDPWREAGRLAGLKREAARDWLAQKIAGTPTSTLSLADATVVATRLTGLLPTREPGRQPAAGARQDTRWSMTRAHATTVAVAVAAAALLFALLHW